MKKIIGIITFVLFLFFFMPNGIVHAGKLSDSIVIQMVEYHNDSQIDIDVKLITNPGISGMTLELVYDKEIFNYLSPEQGPALREMDFMTTDLSNNPDLPIRFNWFNLDRSKENVFSTGTILILHFALKEDCPSGEYKIGFKYSEGDIVYINGNNLASKSAIISQAVVIISDNKISDTEIVDGVEEKKNDFWIAGIVTIVSVPIVAVATLIIVKKIKRKRKSKNWVKI